jgi:hypothetical protein
MGFPGIFIDAFQFAIANQIFHHVIASAAWQSPQYVHHYNDEIASFLAMT